MDDAVSVPAGGRKADYDVIVRRGLLDEVAGLVADRVPAHRYAVVADETVAGLYGERVLRALDGLASADLFTFPPGERHKTRRTWADLTDRLLEAGHGRDSAVVALGGGVTGDLAGFVAATFMRGIPLVQIPTSLVAMVDAAVGGKTGVDVSAGKNLVGAFHPPGVVAVDPDTVGTLPRAERSQGLAEAVKHGAVLDAAYLRRLDGAAGTLLDGEPGAVEDAVRRSVELKAEVVGRDERESGLRQILNFGHTLGHALEAASDYRIPHGSAVALGMILEARLGELSGITREGTADELAGTLRRFELPTEVPRWEDRDRGAGIRDAREILRYVGRDKKGRRGRARFVLLREPGTVDRGPHDWSREVEDEVLAGLLEELPGGS